MMPFVFKTPVLPDTGSSVRPPKLEGRRICSYHCDYWPVINIQISDLGVCRCRGNISGGVQESFLLSRHRSREPAFSLLSTLSFLSGEANRTDWDRLPSEQTRRAAAITAESCSVLYLTVRVKTDGGGMSGGWCEVVEGGDEGADGTSKLAFRRRISSLHPHKEKYVIAGRQHYFGLLRGGERTSGATRQRKLGTEMHACAATSGEGRSHLCASVFKSPSPPW